MLSVNGKAAAAASDRCPQVCTASSCAFCICFLSPRSPPQRDGIRLSPLCQGPQINLGRAAAASTPRIPTPFYSSSDTHSNPPRCHGCLWFHFVVIPTENHRASRSQQPTEQLPCTDHVPCPQDDRVRQKTVTEKLAADPTGKLQICHLQVLPLI